jgi:GT2 family glycosyltransferase
MREPLVSVIIPTYNRAYCLRRAVDCALGQSHRRVEVVLIDDGSTDDTRGLVASAYGADGRVRYCHQENQGVTAARNLGLAQAQGDYIALLDSDDCWEPWKIELQLACLRHCPDLGMVWTDMRAVGPDGTVTHPSYLRVMYGAYRWFTREDLFTASYPLTGLAPGLAHRVGDRSLWTGDIFSQMVMGNLVHTSTVLLSRARLDRVRGFNPELRRAGEDYDFHLRTCREGPVGYIDVAAIDYQTGMPDRLTRPRYRAEVALNCLETVRAVLAADGPRIRVSRSMLRCRLAEVHDWVGESLFEAGETSRARGHLLRSLSYRPLQRRTAELFAASLLPSRVGVALRSLYRSLKARRGPGRRKPSPVSS